MTKIKWIAWVLFYGQIILWSPHFTGYSPPARAASLTVLDGVTIESGQGGHIVVRDTLNAGNAKFTSSSDTPAPGDWNGIKVEGSATGTQFNGTVIEYSGATGSPALEVRKSTPVISGVEIKNNGGAGLKLTGGASPSIRDSVIIDNNLGVEIGAGSRPAIQNSVLSGNTSSILNPDPANTIMATSNWWGHPTGPEDISDDRATGGLYNPDGLGSPVSDGVNYSPWSSVIPILGASFKIAEGVVTESQNINLNLACKTCTESRVSESSTFTGVAFQPFATTLPFTLTTGDALKMVYVQFRASTGNTSSTSAQIRLDTAGPALNVTNPPSDSIIVRPVSIEASASDPGGVNRVEFYIDGALAFTDTTNNYSFLWDITAAADGSHEIRVIAHDNVGHSTADIRPVTVVKAPPLAPEITSPPSGTLTSSSTINVAGKAESGISVSLFVNNRFYGQTAASQSGDFQFAGVNLSEGSNELRATASDKAGTSPPSPLVLVNVDTGPPGPPNIYSGASLPGGEIRVGWAPGVGEVPVTYRLYRANASFNSTSQAIKVYEGPDSSFEEIPVGDGLYYYGATALDAAGNESLLSQVISVVSDREGPSGIVRFTPSPPVGTGDVGIGLSLSEPVAGVPYLGITPAGGDTTAIELTKVTETEWTGIYRVTGSTPHGAANLSFYAKDTIGNKGTQILEGLSLSIDTTGPTGSIQRTPSLDLYKPGTLSLVLTLDEAVSQAPTLVFHPPTDTPVIIDLAGADRQWSGSMEITFAMGDGSGSFTMEAIDRFGNIGTGLSGGTVVLDVTPPGPPVSVTAISKPGGRIDLSWTVQQEAALYRLYRAPADDVIQLPALPVVDNLMGTSYTDIPASDGDYRYAVTAVDTAGNESPLSVNAVALSDRLSPGSPANLSLTVEGENILLTWNAPSGEEGLRYNLYRADSLITDISGLTPIQFNMNQVNATDIPPADTRYYYAVTSLDATGNESPPSNSPDIVYDMAPPAVTVTGISNGQVASSAVIPVITVQDASLAGVFLLLDGAAYTDGTTIASEGQHILRIEATDTSQRTTVKEINFTIDLTDPVITIDGVVEGGNYDTSVTPIITATDANLDRVDITLDGGAYQSGTTVSTDGPHTLIVTAWDKAGRNKAVTIPFSIDAAPPQPVDLSIVANDRGVALLSWNAPGATDIAGYYVYKNGQRLTPSPIMETTYADSSYNNSAVHVYGVSAVDRAGHEGSVLQATVIPVRVSLTRYGNPYGSGFIMSKRYIESIKVDILNQHSSGSNVGPIALELKDEAGRVAEVIQGGVTFINAGGTLSIEKIVPVGSGIVDYRTLDISVQLPSDPGTAVKYVSTFNLNAFDPGRKIEIFNEPLIKGGMARVRLKIYNHGSVPVEVLASSGDKPSTDVYILLKDQNGNVLAKGNLYQRGVGVINYSGYSLAEIAPGGSWLSEPVEFVVPLSATDSVYIEAYVSKIYYHYNRTDQVIGGELKGYSRLSISQAPYYATVNPERALYDQNTPVVLNGEALDTVTGQPVPNASVKIGISVKGFDRYLFATTDEAGRFGATFDPLPGEAGIYSLWATHPDVYDKPVQSGFSILGLTFDPRSVNLRMSKNSSFSFPVSIRNLGESDLTGLQFSVAGGSGITGSVDVSDIGTLQGGKTAGLRVTLNAAIDAPDASSATVTVTTAEGISRSLEISMALLAAVPAIDTDPDYIDVGVNTNDIKVVTFKLKNIGYAPLENIHIEPPLTPWMGITTGTDIASIEPGSSVDIGVSFRPPAGVSQGLHTDKLVIQSGNHIPYTLNLFAMVTSSQKGSVQFRVIDALNELVRGASVTIGHQQVTTIILNGKTDDSGELSFNDIAEGFYNYKVEAPGHEIVTGTFEVLPDVITPMDIFMNNIFVTIEWSVTPMTIFDDYKIELVATYETQVPAPVITVEPAYEELELEIGSTYVGEFRVTNHGLIALENVKIEPGFGPGLKVDVLITELARIGAKDTVVVPYRITVNPFKSPDPVDPCSKIPMEINVRGEWYCQGGRWVPTGGVLKKTIIPKDYYDPLGLCDLKCDWCKCIPYKPAADLCKCIKELSGLGSQSSYADRQSAVCTCLGMFGSEAADFACDCMKSAAEQSMSSWLDCAQKGIGGETLSLIKSAAGGFGLGGAVNTAKNVASCALCIMDLIPPLPSGGTTTVSGDIGVGWGCGYLGGCGYYPSPQGFTNWPECTPGTYR